LIIFSFLVYHRILEIKTEISKGQIVSGVSAENGERKMNLLNKTTPWVAGLLFAAASIFGDDKPARPMQQQQQRKGCGEMSQKVTKAQMMPGYNAASRIDVRGSWDVYATASFVYWQLSQDNMEVAFLDELTNADYVASPGSIMGKESSMSFNFKPGFKVGLGLNLDLDDWDLYAEYTRIHTTNSKSVSAETAADDSTAPVLATAGHPFIVPLNAYNTASEKWNCNLDFINWDMGRAFYVGTQLTFRPFYGVRGGFITQNTHNNYVNTSFSSTGEVRGVKDVYNRAHSWAVGPRVGVCTDWMLGAGFRFFGGVDGDLLYTRYKVQNKTNFLATHSDTPYLIGHSASYISKDIVRTVRSHVDLEGGFGWGSYFDNNNWHIDLSASYGFQVFFDQNMLSTFANSTMAGSVERPAGNLYVQGLTATARFDF